MNVISGSGDTDWEATNHGHLPPPTMEQRREMSADLTAADLYRAQRDAFFPGVRSETAANLIPPDFATIADINAYVLKIQRSAFAKKQWPKFAAGEPVHYYNGHEATAWEDLVGGDSDDPAYLSYGANASTNNETLTVAIQPGSIGHSKTVILHELAHVINDYEGIMRDHGPEFLGIFVKLIRKYVPKRYKALVRELTRRGLIWAE